MRQNLLDSNSSSSRKSINPEILKEGRSGSKHEPASEWMEIFSLQSSGSGAHEGVQAVRNAVKSSIPYFPDYISLIVKSNKETATTRIIIEVRKK